LEYNQQATSNFLNETIKPAAYALSLLPGAGAVALPFVASDIAKAATTKPGEVEIAGTKIPTPNVGNVADVFGWSTIKELLTNDPQFRRDLVKDPVGTLTTLAPLLLAGKAAGEALLRKGVSAETTEQPQLEAAPVPAVRPAEVPSISSLAKESDLVTTDAETGVTRLKTPEETATGTEGTPSKAVAAETTPQQSAATSVAQTMSQQSTAAVQQANEIIKGAAETLHEAKALASPASVSNVARTTAEIMREQIALMTRKFQQVQAALDQAREYLNTKSKPENINIIDSIERGNIDNIEPALQPIAKILKDEFDKRLDEIKKFNPESVRNFIENYFPHLWKDPKGALDVIKAILGRRPWQGLKSFMKERIIPFTKDGLQWRVYDAENNIVGTFATKAEAEAKAISIEGSRIGPPLEPATYNPVDLALLKLLEMDKYIAATKTMNELISKGLAKFYKVGDFKKVPVGWDKINDAISDVYYRNEKGELVKAGSYFAHADAVRIINNYLSPGLRQYAFFRGLLHTGNAMNQYQLGMSAFHLGFTSIDAIVSKIALATKQLYEGDIGSAVKSLLEAPIAPFTTALKGNKYLHEWFYRDQGAEIGTIMDALTSGGARVKMDSFYQVKASESIIKEWKEIWEEAKSGIGLPSAIVKTIPRIFTTIPRLIMEEVVPRQKLGVAASMMKWEMERNPNMTHEQLRHIAAQVWDSVDNRLGQMVYDNLFWNKTLKDVLMISIRSVGWNLGTWRELGGGVMDLAKMPIEFIKTGKKPELTHRASYVIGLNAGIMMTGAITTYLATGRPPQDWRDYFFPPIGGRDANGNPERISLPTYGKEEYQLLRGGVNKILGNAAEMAGAKLNPVLQVTYDLIRNKDYWGTEIAHRDDPFLQRQIERTNYVMKSVVPFSLQGMQKMKEAEVPISKQLLPFIGILPAPRNVNKTEAELLASEINQGKRMNAPRTTEQAQRAQLEMRIRRDLQAGSTASLEVAKEQGQISHNEYIRLKAMKGMSPLQQQVHDMSADEIMRVYNVATPAEKLQLEKIVKAKIDREIKNGTAENRERFKQIKAQYFAGR